MSKKQETAHTDPAEQEIADAKALERATAAATGQQYSREELKAMGLDPAAYGYTDDAE